MRVHIQLLTEPRASLLSELVTRWKHRKTRPLEGPPTEDEYLQSERAWLSTLEPTSEFTHEMRLAEMADIDKKRKELAAATEFFKDGNE